MLLVKGVEVGRNVCGAHAPQPFVLTFLPDSGQPPGRGRLLAAGNSWDRNPFLRKRTCLRVRCGWAERSGSLQRVLQVHH
jgi:hypothetical protein